MIAQKIRIYPNRTQQALLDKYFGYARWCFNKALALWQEKYAAGAKPTERSIRDLLKTDLPDWTPKSSKSILDTACENLGAAFSNFFAHRASYPAFKSKHSAKQSFGLYRKNDSSIRIRDGKWLVKDQAIRMSENLRFSRTIKRLTCSKQYGKYYISLIFDEDLPKPANNGKSIGLDWGIKNKKGQGNYFTGDQGQKFDLPELAALEDKLKFCQKQLSRKKRGSARYIKAKTKFDAVQERVNNIKKDAQNKLVANLVNSYAVIAVEGLSINSMVHDSKSKKGRRRAILRYSNYEIRKALEHKAYEFRAVSRWCPSSQLCSACGTRHREMKDLSIRTLKCSCGLVIDRDINAAINILKYSVASKN